MNLIFLLNLIYLKHRLKTHMFSVSVDLICLEPWSEYTPFDFLWRKGFSGILKHIILIELLQ